MHWTEPATSDHSHSELEKKLWARADLRPRMPLGEGAEDEIDDSMPTYFTFYPPARIGDPRKEEIAFSQTSGVAVLTHRLEAPIPPGYNTHETRTPTRVPASRDIKMNLTLTYHASPRDLLYFQSLAASKHHFAGVKKIVSSNGKRSAAKIVGQFLSKCALNLQPSNTDEKPAMVTDRRYSSRVLAKFVMTIGQKNPTQKIIDYGKKRVSDTSLLARLFKAVV